MYVYVREDLFCDIPALPGMGVAGRDHHPVPFPAFLIPVIPAGPGHTSSEFFFVKQYITLYDVRMCV